MHTTRFLVAGLLGLLGAATACTNGTAPAGTPHRGNGAAVLLLGDSVAAGQAAALTEAFAAGGMRFTSLASEGGGNVVGPNAAATWTKLRGALAGSAPDVVVYQVTTYDWGSAQEQQDAYRRLSEAVTGAGATLVIVTAPPIRPDGFYAPHLAELAHTRDAAVAATAASAGRAHLLDAREVWGEEYRQQRDGKADRSSDGVHTCPQGAARFTVWLLGRLAALVPGITPAAPETWANTGWSADRRFVGC